MRWSRALSSTASRSFSGPFVAAAAVVAADDADDADDAKAAALPDPCSVAELVLRSSVRRRSSRCASQKLWRSSMIARKSESRRRPPPHPVRLSLRLLLRVGAARSEKRCSWVCAEWPSTPANTTFGGDACDPPTKCTEKRSMRVQYEIDTTKRSRPPREPEP